MARELGRYSPDGTHGFRRRGPLAICFSSDLNMQATAVDKSLLTNLVPPQALNAENFLELARKAVMEPLKAGKTIFKLGDCDRQTIYLIDGKLELEGERGTVELEAGSEKARHPIADHLRTALDTEDNTVIFEAEADHLERLAGHPRCRCDHHLGQVRIHDG